MAAECDTCGRTMAAGFDLEYKGTRCHVDLQPIGESQSGQTVYRCRRCRHQYPFDSTQSSYTNDEPNDL